MIERKIGDKTLRLIRGDITDLEIESFVYYARPDLQLGAGYGGAIAVRGGPAVQKELDQVGGLAVGEAVVTGAGKMKSQYIVHAVGPQFQEEDEEAKLRRTIRACFDRAGEKGIKALAFPPLGAGFYVMPLDRCSRVMVETIEEYLNGDTPLEEVVIVALDSREYLPFEEVFQNR